MRMSNIWSAFWAASEVRIVRIWPRRSSKSAQNIRNRNKIPQNNPSHPPLNRCYESAGEPYYIWCPVAALFRGVGHLRALEDRCDIVYIFFSICLWCNINNILSVRRRCAVWLFLHPACAVPLSGDVLHNHSLSNYEIRFVQLQRHGSIGKTG